MPIELELPGMPGAPAPAAAAPEPEEYNIQVERRRMGETLVGSDEIDALVSTINAYDTATILEFGGQPAKEVARCSDKLLNSMSAPTAVDPGLMLANLGRIMKTFDVKEIQQLNKKSLLPMSAGWQQKKLDQMLERYRRLGDELDRIQVHLKQYEWELKETNKKMDDLFYANVNYFQQLVKYILAGEQGLRELEQHIATCKAEFELTKDPNQRFDIETLEQSYRVLQRRVEDLRLAEVVAMQSIPSVKLVQNGNLDMIRKINSAFLVTLPVFKQALSQAVMFKRQQIQAESMKSLRKSTNEMLRRNADNQAAQVAAARLAAEDNERMGKLEDSFRTIIDGIDEVKNMQKEDKRKKQEETRLLEEAQQRYQASFGQGSSQ